MAKRRVVGRPILPSSGIRNLPRPGPEFLSRLPAPRIPSPILAIAVFIVIASSLSAEQQRAEQPSAPSSAAENPVGKNERFVNVETALAKLTSARGMATASVGFALLPLKEATAPVVDFHGATSLTPASTMKLITTATALRMLGPEFSFETKLGYSGSIDTDTGELDGDIFITGGGDPTLAANGWKDLFQNWHEAVSKAGIRKISGGVVGDASLFGTQMVPGAWQWSDVANYYASGASGLTFHKNLYRIYFQPSGDVGSIASLLRQEPPIPGLQLTNEMRIGPSGSGDQGYVYGAPYGEGFFLRGSVPRGTGAFAIKAAIPDPAFLCAHLFQESLKKAGIRTEGLDFHDGCGLSRANLLSARQLAYFLRSVDASEIGPAFLKSLPVAGKSGTLKNVAAGTIASGRIHAKSGTLSRIKCYAGYVNARSGERFAFALLINNYAQDYGPVKKGIENVMTAMASL